jgi:hypothetical protein
MTGIDDISVLLLGQAFVAETEPPNYLLIGILGVIGLAIIIAMAVKIRNWTQYDLDGSYGGGRGLKRVFRHKRLKRHDREARLRGKARMFEDAELEMLLDSGKISEAAKYLTGLLNAAKQSGDKHTMRRYGEYHKELLEMYDEKVLEAHGGKAVHLKK